MSEPVHHLGDRGRFGSWGYRRAVDHDHRQVQRARGGDFGIGASAARVLGHHEVDRVVAHQGHVARDIKRPARHDDPCVRQGQRCLRSFDKTQGIAMPGSDRECRQVHSSDSQKDIGALAVQCGHGTCHVWHMEPAVPGFGAPCRPRQRDEWHAGGGAGDNGMATHLRGKGMCGIHNVGDALAAQIADQTRDTSKPADAQRQRLVARPCHAASQGHGAGHARCIGSAGKRCGFGRAAEDQEVGRDG